MTAHHEALDKLSFVHEWRQASDPLAGKTFVPQSYYEKYAGTTPPLRVEITPGEETTLYVFDGFELDYRIVFDARTPGSVVNNAVAAALQEIR